MPGYSRSNPDSGRRLVESVRQVLSSSETPRQRALRLASAAASPDTSEVDRVTFLRSAFAAEPEIARRWALELGYDDSYLVRLTCAEIIRDSRGSEDDLPRLLSLAAREPGGVVQTMLRESIDSLRTRSAEDSLTALLTLLDIPAPASGPELLGAVSDPSQRQRLTRWSDKVVSRTAGGAGYAAIITGCAELAAIMLDTAVVTAADRSAPIVDADVVEAVRNSLNGRPSPARLAADPTVRDRLPWAASAALLAELDQDRSHQPPFLTSDADVTTAMRMLADVTRGWLSSIGV